MDGPEDVQMAEAPSSRSSSLSPPPSSLPDTFEYHWEEEVVTTAPGIICQSTGHKVPDTDISLSSITLATPISAATPISEVGEDEEMAMTRAQRAAEEAKKAGVAPAPPIPSLVTKVEKPTTTKRRRPNGTSTKTQGVEEESGDEAAGKKPTKTTTTKKSPPKKTPPQKVATEPEVNGGDSPDNNKKKGPVKKSPTSKPTAEPPTKKPSPAKGIRVSGRGNKGKKPETADVPKTTPAAIKKKPPKKTGWEPEKVLTSSRSRLTDLLGNQLRNMLCTSEAWDVLPIQDKADIIALMPQTIPVVPRTATSDSRPDALFLANSDNFNFDCGQYVDHLRNGQHDPRWILEAMDAHDQHNNGDFDSLIQEKFTHDWEEEWPTESKDGEDQEGEDGEGGEEVVNGEEGEQSDTNA